MDQAIQNMSSEEPEKTTCLPDTHVKQVPRIDSEWRSPCGGLAGVQRLEGSGVNVLIYGKKRHRGLDWFLENYTPHIPKPKKKVPKNITVKYPEISVNMVDTPYYVYQGRLYDSNNDSFFDEPSGKWELNDPENGAAEVLPVEFVEWVEVEG